MNNGSLQSIANSNTKWIIISTRLSADYLMLSPVKMRTNFSTECISGDFVSCFMKQKVKKKEVKN